MESNRQGVENQQENPFKSVVRNGNVILIGISQLRANVSDHDGYRCRLERSRSHRRSNSRGTMAWTRELTNNHPLFMRQLRRFIYGASRPLFGHRLSETVICSITILDGRRKLPRDACFSSSKRLLNEF